MFGKPYHKIQTAFKRDEQGIIIPFNWTLSEFVYLQDNPWIWTEKIDGMNIRIHWDGEQVMIGGRSDNASIPADLITALYPYTDHATWKRMFPDADDVTLYGEGYGAGIQKGGGYRKDKGFILFDVNVGNWWLRDDSIAEVAAGFGLDVVPQVGVMSLNDAWKKIVLGGLTSAWPDVKIEGIVGRPQVPLFTRKGERLIAKLKLHDLEEYQAKNS